MEATKLTASMIYAQSFSLPCSGEERCYWCSAPCERRWPHGVPKAEVGTKKTWLAKWPSSNWICQGCFLFRKPLVTVQFCNGGYQDRACPMNFSWIIMEHETPLVLRWADQNPAYKILLNPPLRFCLSWIDPPEQNQIQLAEVNDLTEIKADTKLIWNLNNKPFYYTIYELEIALQQGIEGREPGVRELVRRLGPYKLSTSSVRDSNLSAGMDMVSSSENSNLSASIVEGLSEIQSSPQEPKKKRGRPKLTDETKAMKRAIKAMATGEVTS